MPLPATIAAERRERLRLPDVRRPEQMPLWPEWVASRIASLRVETQPDPKTGRYRPHPTLPSQLILTAAQREELAQHVDDLLALCQFAPASDVAAQNQMLIALTRMMMALPSAAQTELGAEARGEAYMDALDDLPPWAIEAAIRRWNRGDCGTSNQNKAYDYRWCPAPAELRRIAYLEMHRVKGRANDLQALLDAAPRIEWSEAHCAVMRRRLAGLLRGLNAPPVGTDGSGGLARVTAPRVPTVGRSQRHKPGLEA